MKAAIWRGVGDVRLEERPVPEVQPGDLLLRVLACGVCGTDLRTEAHGNDRVEPGRVLGHEIAGEVVEVGPGVSGFAPGDRLCVGAEIPCGRCGPCRVGQPNCCELHEALGYQYDGGFADFVRLPKRQVELGPVRRFAAALPPHLAALAEPVACCVNGFERVGGVRPGARVVIFGAGPIGRILAMLATSRYGASSVAMFEPHPWRRAQAAAAIDGPALDPYEDGVGPVEAILDWTRGAGADLVFTACSVRETHEQAIAMVARQGAVNLFGGLPSGAEPIAVSPNWLHYREAVLTGSHGSTPANHAEALKLISERTIDLEPLVTSRLPLERIAEGFAPGQDRLKTVVEPA